MKLIKCLKLFKVIWFFHITIPHCKQIYSFSFIEKFWTWAPPHPPSVLLARGFTFAFSTKQSVVTGLVMRDQWKSSAHQDGSGSALEKTWERFSHICLSFSQTLTQMRRLWCIKINHICIRMKLVSETDKFRMKLANMLALLACN